MNIMSLLNSDDENEKKTTNSFSLDEDYNSTTNALAILQYLTCPKCQQVFFDPITFQCGNSICRRCLPNPSNPSLNRNFKCPIYGCGKPHSLDCKTDVILQKLAEICRKELSSFLPLTSKQFHNNNISSSSSSLSRGQSNNNHHYNNNNYNNNYNVVDEKDFRLLNHYQNMSDSEDEVDNNNHHRSSSKISELLNPNNNIIHDSGGGSGGSISDSNPINNNFIITTTNISTTFDMNFDLRQIKELLLTELDCQICYSLFIDPITTPCGHSFCKPCITRSLDHSATCPLCRRALHNYNAYLYHPINKTINSFIMALYPSIYSERRFMLESEFYNTMQDTPIFVTNSLIFPKMPCFLHIFEPKYRLMIRRCMQSRQRQFGMVLARGNAYLDYGTMLEIRSAEFLTDGRSLVETIGTYKFRVIERGVKDGYDVGRIERIDDVSPEEELRIEREDIRRAEINNVNNPLNDPIQECTTSELIGISREFIDTLRNGNSPWILQRLNSTYGDMPDEPSDFSYWVASVIPIAEIEKYKLLELRSVRERLKLIVEWIKSLRDQWWFARGCSIS